MAFNCSTELPHCTLSMWPDPHHGIVKPYGSVQNNTDTWLSENNKYNIYQYVPRNVQQCKLKLDTNNAPHVNNLRVKPLEGAKKPICFQQHILSNSLQPVDFNLFSCGDRNQMYKMMFFCAAVCQVMWSVLTSFHSLFCESHYVFPSEFNCLKVFSNQINLNDTNLKN